MKKEYDRALTGALRKFRILGLAEKSEIVVLSDMATVPQLMELGISRTHAYDILAERQDPSLAVAFDILDVVYFVGCPAVDAVKIGVTSIRVYERLNGMQVNCPLELKLLAAVEGGCALEKELHQRFAHLRIRGEWFRLAGEISAHIALLPKPEKPQRGWWGQKRNRAQVAA
jgi:hypothetical protein